MGKSILTSHQLEFLELASVDKQITKWFYLTGGTALAEFYLHHRLSEDLDFFIEEKEVDQILVDAFLKKISPKLNITQVNRSNFLGLVSFLLTFKDGEKLKVDFNFYPFKRIGKAIKFNSLEIDSIYDIAVNKTHVLFMKPRSRDYVDLYFIMRKYKYSLNKLILDAKIKFDWHIDKFNLASQFLRVKEFADQSPEILKPYDRKKMEEFFMNHAKALESEIFKK